MNDRNMGKFELGIKSQNKALRTDKLILDNYHLLKYKTKELQFYFKLKFQNKL